MPIELLATPVESRFLFPALGHPERPMSENTVGKALRIMGYSTDDMSAHGFRSLASTLLNELGWPPDAIEKQLAHIEEDEVRGAYNYAKYLPIRRTMLRMPFVAACSGPQDRQSGDDDVPNSSPSWFTVTHSSGRILRCEESKVGADMGLPAAARASEPPTPRIDARRAARHWSFITATRRLVVSV